MKTKLEWLQEIGFKAKKQPSRDNWRQYRGDILIDIGEDQL